MTRLYRSVLIESAGQVEALPDEAIVINSSGDRYNRTPWGQWHSAADDRDLFEDLGSRIFPVTITALVPVEAEEEILERRKACQKTPDVLRRYVTEWEHYTPREEA